MSQAFQQDVHFGYEETRALVDQEGTCFKQVTSHQHVTLNPRFIGAVSKGIKEQLQDQLHLYSESLGGIPVTFGKVKVRRRYGSILEEQPYLHFDCVVEFIVFQPRVGSQLVAVVNKICEDHLSLLIHGAFNAAVYSNKFGDNSGWKCASLKLGDQVLVEVLKFRNFGGVISMRSAFIKALHTDTDGETGDIMQEMLPNINLDISIDAGDTTLPTAAAVSVTNTPLDNPSPPPQLNKTNRGDQTKRESSISNETETEMGVNNESQITGDTACDDMPMPEKKVKKKNKEKRKSVDDQRNLGTEDFLDGCHLKSKAATTVNAESIDAELNATTEPPQNVSPLKKKKKRKRDAVERDVVERDTVERDAVPTMDESQDSDHSQLHATSFDLSMSFGVVDTPPAADEMSSKKKKSKKKSRRDAAAASSSFDDGAENKPTTENATDSDDMLDESLHMTSFDLSAMMEQSRDTDGKTDEKSKKKKWKHKNSVKSNDVVAHDTDCVERTEASADIAKETIASVQSAKKKKKKHSKHEAQLSQTQGTAANAALTNSCDDVTSQPATESDAVTKHAHKKKKRSSINVTSLKFTGAGDGVKKEDNESIGSLDSGLGALSPPVENTAKGASRKKHKKSKRRSHVDGDVSAVDGDVSAVDSASNPVLSTSLPLTEASRDIDCSVVAEKKKSKKKSRHTLAGDDVRNIKRESLYAQVGLDTAQTTGVVVKTESTIDDDVTTRAPATQVPAGKIKGGKKRKRDSSVPPPTGVAVSSVTEDALDCVVKHKKKKSKHK